MCVCVLPSALVLPWWGRVQGVIVPRIASLFAEKKAYNYLAGSVQETLPVEKIASIVEKNGCKNTQVSRYSLGAACRVMATKVSHNG